MPTVIYATPADTCETLQQIIDDAMIEKWREETQTQPPRGLLLSGETIQHIHMEVTPCKD